MIKQQYNFEEKIWSIYDDAKSGLIIIVCKSKESKLNSYFAIDLVENKLEKLEIPLENSIKWDIECVYNQVIYFHSYQSESSPLHQYIIAFNLLSKTIIWESYTYIFEKLASNGLLVKDIKIENAKSKCLDFHTGEKIEKEEIVAIKSDHLQLPDYQNFTSLNESQLAYGSFLIKATFSEKMRISIFKNEKLLEEFSFPIGQIQSIAQDYYMRIHSSFILLTNSNELIIYTIKEEKN